MTASAHSPTCEALEAVPRSPSARYQASNPWASQNAPIAVTLASPARHSRSAASSPNRSHSPVRSPQKELTNPPLRPLGPPPQMSCSRSTTSTPGSSCRRNHAVHMPVKPPPKITTSAVVSPTSGGQGAPANSGTASASRSHQLRPRSGGISDRVIADSRSGAETEAESTWQRRHGSRSQVGHPARRLAIVLATDGGVDHIHARGAQRLRREPLRLAGDDAQAREPVLGMGGERGADLATQVGGPHPVAGVAEPVMHV